MLISYAVQLLFAFTLDLIQCNGMRKMRGKRKPVVTGNQTQW